MLRKDNGPKLGVRLLLPVLAPQQAFIRNSSLFELSTVKSCLCQINLHNVNETDSLVVTTDSSWLSMNNVVSSGLMNKVGFF